MGTRPRPGPKVAQRAALGSVEDSESIGDTRRVTKTGMPSPVGGLAPHGSSASVDASVATAYADADGSNPHRPRGRPRQPRPHGRPASRRRAAPPARAARGAAGAQRPGQGLV